MQRSVRELEARAATESAGTRASTVQPRRVSARRPKCVRHARAADLRFELDQLERQIAIKGEEEQRLRAIGRDYQQRIDRVPARESELAELTRDYSTLQTLYQTLLAKQEESKIAANLERRQIGAQFKLIDPARVAQKPFSPRRWQINLLGMVAGLSLGLALVGLLEYRDRTFNTDAEVRSELTLPVLAVVPSDGVRRRAAARGEAALDRDLGGRRRRQWMCPNRHLFIAALRLVCHDPVLNLRVRPLESAAIRTDGMSRRTVTDPNLPPACREQYRQLAATLHNAQAVSGVKAIMIASAVAGEGKTLTAANLALTFTDSYERKVLLVDADLRRPSLHRFFAAGDPDARAEATPSGAWTEHVRQVTPRLGILTREQPSSVPMADLTSGRMRELIQEARQAVDWIVVDTPPIALLPDASLLAAVVDGAVLVVRAGSTPLDLVKRAVDAIDPKKTLGVVLNAATRQARDARYGYHAYYSQIEPS